MIAKLFAWVYNYLRFSAIMCNILPPSPLEELARIVGGRKARLLREGVLGYCDGSPTAMGHCARELDKRGGICGFDDSPMLALLLSRTVMIATKQLTPAGGIPDELRPLLHCVRLILPAQHILPAEAMDPMRIGRAK